MRSLFFLPLSLARPLPFLSVVPTLLCSRCLSRSSPLRPSFDSKEVPSVRRDGVVLRLDGSLASSGRVGEMLLSVLHRFFSVINGFSVLLLSSRMCSRATPRSKPTRQSRKVATRRRSGDAFFLAGGVRVTAQSPRSLPSEVVTLDASYLLLVPPAFDLAGVVLGRHTVTFSPELSVPGAGCTSACQWDRALSGLSCLTFN